MADDLSNLSTAAISPVGEALREFKYPPDKRRRERAKGNSIALENLAEEDSIEELIEHESAEEEAHQLDVSA